MNKKEESQDVQNDGDWETEEKVVFTETGVSTDSIDSKMKELCNGDCKYKAPWDDFGAVQEYYDTH